MDGCGGKHFGRGYCRTHYERWKRNGDVELRKDSSRPCVVEGCERTHFGKGMCRPHYRRFMKYGDPVAPAPSQRTNTYERWLSYVEKTDTCWLWRGSMWESTGYGRFWVDDKTVLVHRWSYEHHVGPIPKGKHLDHLCRVRNCVRPDHLEPVTARENLLRGETQAAKNAAKTHCPRGHPYDKTNTYIDCRGARSCITCRKASDAARREKKRLAKEA